MAENGRKYRHRRETISLEVAGGVVSLTVEGFSPLTAPQQESDFVFDLINRFKRGPNPATVSWAPEHVTPAALKRLQDELGALAAALGWKNQVVVLPEGSDVWPVDDGLIVAEIVEDDDEPTPSP